MILSKLGEYHNKEKQPQIDVKHEFVYNRIYRQKNCMCHDLMFHQ